MNQPLASSNAPWDLIQRIAAHFTPLAQVAAIALAGSQTVGTKDEKSDLDLYIFTRAEVPLEARRLLAEKHAAQRAEIGNDEWGPGDEWADGESGRAIDLIYFGTTWIEGVMDRILIEHQAALGYTTAFWSTLQRAVPVYDRDGWLANMQTRANQPYPEELRRAIIAKNQPILRSKASAYLRQIEKAWARQDRVSLNHRLAALLASYFDILFALNRVPHPGEKRLMWYARELCPLRPNAMETHMEALLCAQSTAWQDNRIIREANVLIDELDKLLMSEGFL